MQRFGIFAHRPAPIQVSYLGFPGTTGADFIDYVIADEIVLPFDQQPFWSEKIVHLPGCYQVNDTKRQIAERTPTRKECGLPDGASSFAASTTTTRSRRRSSTFGCGFSTRSRGACCGSCATMRPPSRTCAGGRGSRHRPGASRLRRSPAARGASGAPPLGRFVPRHASRECPHDGERCALGGLAGAHLIGKAFAARVAASLLHAVGLPELVTRSLEEYEALAFKLAREPSLLCRLSQAAREKPPDGAALRHGSVPPASRASLYDHARHRAARREAAKLQRRSDPDFGRAKARRPHQRRCREATQ